MREVNVKTQRSPEGLRCAGQPLKERASAREIGVQESGGGKHTQRHKQHFGKGFRH